MSLLPCPLSEGWRRGCPDRPRTQQEQPYAHAPQPQPIRCFRRYSERLTSAVQPGEELAAGLRSWTEVPGSSTWKLCDFGQVA